MKSREREWKKNIRALPCRGGRELRPVNLAAEVTRGGKPGDAEEHILEQEVLDASSVPPPTRSCRAWSTGARALGASPI